jgi:hypothetical protein
MITHCYVTLFLLCRMAESSAAAASTAAVPSEVTVPLKVKWGGGGVAQTMKLSPTLTVGDLATKVVAYFDLQPRSLALFVFYDEEQKSRARTAAIMTADAAIALGGKELRNDEVLIGAIGATWLLAVGTPQAAPSSTTGKCAHSIVFPSVARSSLTWSCALCVRCVVALCRGRKR